MSIASLSTLSLDTFKGARGISERTSSNALVALLNTAIAKVNEIITDMNNGELDVLSVGSGTGTYYGTSDSWFQVDGTHAPTASRYRIQDVTDGSFGTIINTSGTLSVV